MEEQVMVVVLFILIFSSYKMIILKYISGWDILLLFINSSYTEYDLLFGTVSNDSMLPHVWFQSNIDFVEGAIYESPLMDLSKYKFICYRISCYGSGYTYGDYTYGKNFKIIDSDGNILRAVDARVDSFNISTPGMGNLVYIGDIDKDKLKNAKFTWNVYVGSSARLNGIALIK